MPTFHTYQNKTHVREQIWSEYSPNAVNILDGWSLGQDGKMGGELVRLLLAHPGLSLVPLWQRQRPWRIQLWRDQLKGELERPYWLVLNFKKYEPKQHLVFPVLVYFCIPCPLNSSELLYIYLLLLLFLPSPPLQPCPNCYFQLYPSSLSAFVFPHRLQILILFREAQSLQNTARFIVRPVFLCKVQGKSSV